MSGANPVAVAMQELRTTKTRWNLWRTIAPDAKAAERAATAGTGEDHREPT
jgi:hypothetical protein